MSEQSNDTGLGNVAYVVRSVEGATAIARGNITNSKMSERPTLETDEKWETFCDESYYHLWRVRRKTERGFNDGFHIQHGEEAKALVELLNRLELERNEWAERWADLSRASLRDICAMERERNECAAMCGQYRQERDIAEQDATNYHARTIELINERDKMRQERDEARGLLASEKITRDHIIKRGIEMQKERDEAKADAARIADILSGLELRTTGELARLERERNAALELAEAFHRDQVTLLLERDSTNDCKK